jgi:alkylation response protein AidB-like acyl-CoA dehydrogenase
MRTIRDVGTPEQQARFYEDMKRGDRLCAFCLTEPNHGSDASSLETRAESEGEIYIVNGTKSYITLGSRAHYYLAFVRTGPGKRTGGISALVIPRETPGLLFGKKERKMGLGGSVTTEVIFQKARVPKANRLLGEGEGWQVLIRVANTMRVWGAASLALGIAEGAYDLALAHARTRVQFKRKIAAFQAVRFMLSDMKTAIEAARSLIFRTAALIDSGKGDFREIETLVSMSKCYASDVAMQVTEQAVQICGAEGIRVGSGLERRMRDAKAVQIFDGSNQIQRMIISKNLVLD